MEQMIERLLSERDQKVLKESGYADGGAFTWDSRTVGAKFAVIVIDMQRFIVGDDESIFDAIEKQQLAIGEAAWSALPDIRSVIETARSHDVPVFFTRIIPSGEHELTREDLSIVDPIAPKTDEPVIEKSYTSSFFGTDLGTRLTQHGIDTVVLVGNVTSGCVRATAVDAVQNGYNVIVPPECVFDRLEISHQTALLEMWMKYASIIDRQTTESKLREQSN